MGGRILPALTAGLIGYLIGGWHPAALHASDDPSAADAVALRFPKAWNEAAPAPSSQNALPDSGVLNDPGATTAAAGTAPSDAQLALLDPQPMVPQARPQPVSQPSQEPAPVQLASAEIAEPSPALGSNPARRQESRQVMPARIQRPVKSAAAVAPHRPMDRPGYMLDDAQIASIKERLHLTPEQQQMWPAVEAALRNIAYTRAQQARGRATPPAGIDPDSVEGLKSAAVPLIMSFNDDQKQEVRNLAHVMGLDQLASEF